MISRALHSSILVPILLLLLVCGCGAKKKPIQLQVLVPADGDRPATLVPLPPDWASMTIAQLRNFQGCLGVDVAQTALGKNCIFATFRDKQAAVNWYNTEIHQRLVSKVSFYRTGDHVPLANVPDDAGPILLVATMTRADKAPDGVPGAVYISIELFEHLPAGVRFGNGMFLPLE
jgi:hypothetical protein